jgi:hypothetical protein
MDQDEVRNELEAQITALVKARRATNNQAEEVQLTEAIEELERGVRRINIAAADQLGPKMDALLEELEEIRTHNNLDALSALGRTIHRLRAVGQGGGNG